MRHGMAGSRSKCELRDQIEWIDRGSCPGGHISEYRARLLPGAGSMTTQTILILIDGWRQDGRSVCGTDSRYPPLRNAQGGCWSKGRNTSGRMRVMAVDAGCVPIMV